MAYCGDTTAGQYVNTLGIVDIVTGWTETRAVSDILYPPPQHLMVLFRITLVFIRSAAAPRLRLHSDRSRTLNGADGFLMTSFYQKYPNINREPHNNAALSC